MCKTKRFFVIERLYINRQRALGLQCMTAAEGQVLGTPDINVVDNEIHWFLMRK